MLVTVSDKKQGVDTDGDNEADYYTANVLSANDYYPFGWSMPGRKFNSGDYRFGFNGTEKVPEINNGHNTTFFREQDTRIARWWSIDPKTREFESPYAMIGNNPIMYMDPFGDTTRVYNEIGELMETIPDSYDNQDHFINSENFSHNLDFGTAEQSAIDGLADQVREESSFFIGPSTRKQLAGVLSASNSEGLENLFVFGYTMANRELQVYNISDKLEGRKKDEFNASKAKSAANNFMANNPIVVIGWGHSHLYASSDNQDDWIPSRLGKPSDPTRDFTGFVNLKDYAAIIRSGGNPSILVSPFGYTIYTTMIRTDTKKDGFINPTTPGYEPKNRVLNFNGELIWKSQ